MEGLALEPVENEDDGSENNDEEEHIDVAVEVDHDRTENEREVGADEKTEKMAKDKDELWSMMLKLVREMVDEERRKREREVDKGEKERKRKKRKGSHGDENKDDPVEEKEVSSEKMRGDENSNNVEQQKSKHLFLYIFTSFSVQLLQKENASST